MATWSTVTTPVTATAPSSTTFGIPVAADLNFLAGLGPNQRPYCFAYQSSAQTLPAATTTAVNLNAESEDTDGMHVNTGGSNSYFTVVTAGVYLVIAQISFPSTTSGHDNTIITLNGATNTIASTAMPNIGAAHNVQASVYVRCAVADQIGLSGFSTSSGGSLATGTSATFMQAMWQRF